MFSKVNSIGLQGFSAQLVEVEADLSAGLPRFDLVGLPGSSVSEARERVRAAIKNGGWDFPISRITVNLAPAEFRKTGTCYDLPILLAILVAGKQWKPPAPDTVVLGEVSLDGALRPVKGMLPMLLAAKELGMKAALIPAANVAEASVVSGMDIYGAATLQELEKHLNGEKPIAPVSTMTYEPDDLVMPDRETGWGTVDFADIRGQVQAKLGMEIAAAGGHNILLTGTPGAGKSMLAKALPTILPAMTYREALETTKVYSISGLLPPGEALVRSRPFRSPHHSATAVSLTGGGNQSRPGEVSLANNGVLFLDELPLFQRHVLESLRQPLEDRQITVTRNRISATYPCNLMLVCAMNPCPCGYQGDPRRHCTCSPQQIRTYKSKISGPLLDRIDIQIAVSPVDWSDLMGTASHVPLETSADVRQRVEAARARQRLRFQETGITSNACIPASRVREFCTLEPDAEQVLVQAFQALRLSARANDKILRTARTVADLNENDTITRADLQQAIQFRSISFQS